MNEELVVLVDENDNQIGTCAKALLHHANTPLHRAFSSYIFNQEGRVLVQRRAKSKMTWAGFWSSSCCGRPTVGEEQVKILQEVLALRSLGEEVGITLGIEGITDIAISQKRL